MIVFEKGVAGHGETLVKWEKREKRIKQEMSLVILALGDDVHMHEAVDLAKSECWVK